MPYKSALHNFSVKFWRNLNYIVRKHYASHSTIKTHSWCQLGNLLQKCTLDKTKPVTLTYSEVLGRQNLQWYHCLYLHLAFFLFFWHIPSQTPSFHKLFPILRDHSITTNHIFLYCQIKLTIFWKLSCKFWKQSLRYFFHIHQSFSINLILINTVNFICLLLSSFLVIRDSVL